MPGGGLPLQIEFFL
uniref:Uncharacterized protein n=1 Tax=Arundo donax TaxID=35708 RepID=A0A0A9FRF7_ARUDO